ncbi:hypothetical protein [Paenibacillus humicola]|uniref:hypothetical protein n=1 Tax=Paenibacillus humicola TaxID=3110540 RepID=UPI00237ADA02|nr:hypothetical protein [Paenibacillus humicola]
MKRAGMLLLLACVGLAGCGTSVDSLEGQVDHFDAKAKTFNVGCTDEANKGKKGAIADVGYLCTVHYSAQTIFRDESGKPMKPGDFTDGMIVRVHLAKPVSIRRSIEHHKLPKLNADEIALMARTAGS